MTPTPPSPTRVVVEIDGERRDLSGRFRALFLDLLSWYEAINSAPGTVKVTSNTKVGRDGRVASVKSSVEFFKE